MNPDSRADDRLILMGGIAICMTILFRIGDGALDGWLWISLISISFSLPALAACMLMLEEERRRRKHPDLSYTTMLFTLGGSGAILALLGWIGHVSWIAAITFIFCSIICLLLILRHSEEVRD